MRMTIYEALTMIECGETPKEYKKLINKLRKLYDEMYWLIDAIDVLGDDPRAEKKKKRLDKVLETIESLK